MDSYERRIRTYVILLGSVILVGIVGFSWLEGFSLLDSLYLTIVTIATVGYGDLHPVTAGGKVLAIVLIVTGVGCFLGVVANLVENMAYREERARRLEKTNMLVGLFYTEMGTSLLSISSRLDPGREELARLITGDGGEVVPNPASVSAALESRTYSLDCRELDLASLRDTLGAKLDFLTLLLQNPDLEEHSRFTELLQALLHFWQELSHREILCDLPRADAAHLSGDLNRVYRLLVMEWVIYLGKLKAHYPYLYSLAVRTNPFDEKASVTIRD